MIKRSLAGVLAGLCTITSTAAVLPSVTASAEDAYTMNVTVKLDGTKKEISPYIYGVNAFDASSLKNLTTNNIRQGGNRFTGYNWETNWSNAGEDWHNSSDTNQGDTADGFAGAVKNFSGIAADNNVAYKLATLQMAGYVAADKDGEVTKAETAPSKRWNEVVFKKDGELSLTPDLTDDKVYMDEYVNYLVKTLGNAKSEKGIQGYSLDNEPVLWNDTHPYLHPEEVSSTELITKSIELAKVVKDIDPDAEVFGPAFWGMLPCMNCGDGSDIKDESGNKIGTYEDKDWQAVKANYKWFLDYYLESMAKAEKENGKRLLDVVDVHYYSQGINSDDDILQAARSLYDPEYEENSWLMPWGKGYFPFIQRISESIEKYYPGTKIAISEYNLGNIGAEDKTGKDIRTGIAEAEALGCFADNNVYFATYWGTLTKCPYVRSAINIYTNYDGNGAKFGDTLVEASTEDLSKSYAYAAINGKDDTQVTMVIGNKEKSTEKATIDLTGTDTKYKSATVYAVTQEDSGIRVISIDNDIKDNKVTVELPALSFAQVVFSDKESDAEVYVAPVVDTKEVEYSFDELKKSEKGYIIPVEDKEHLKRIILKYDHSCTSGAEWYGGGGAFCFNSIVKSDGTLAGWGSKAYSFGLNDGGQCIVEMDGTFTLPNPDGSDKGIDISKATFNDTSIEMQEWWRNSKAVSDGSDIVMNYKSVTLVYESEGKAAETTTTAPAETTTAAPAETTTAAPAETTKAAETTTAAPAAKLIGDANADGKVSVADATAILQFIGNKDKYPLKPEGLANADCFDPGDGVTAKDALAIQRLDAKAIDKLPELSK